MPLGSVCGFPRNAVCSRLRGVNGAWPELALIAVFVVINALLSGTEIALISLRDPQLRRMAERGGTGALVADLAGDPNRFLATIQIGITLAGFLASAVAAVSLAEPLLPAFEVFGDAAKTVAIVTVTIVLAFITLLFGELVPKRLALQRPERWALTMGRPLQWFSVAMTPLQCGGCRNDETRSVSLSTSSAVSRASSPSRTSSRRWWGKSMTRRTRSSPPHAPMVPTPL